jgi:hypothetical protein
MLLTYINRLGKTHFFRAATTAKGGTRYYITKSDKFPDLIQTLPDGFEIYEDPHDGRVSFRKIVPCLVTKAEIAEVKKAVESLSDLKDIFIQGEMDVIIVWHSQFNSISGQDENLTPEEAAELFGESVIRWKKYDENFLFRLVDEDKRIFRAERKVYMSFNGAYTPLKEGTGSLKALTQKFCPYMGRESYFDTVPEGFVD